METTAMDNLIGEYRKASKEELIAVINRLIHEKLTDHIAESLLGGREVLLRN